MKQLLSKKWFPHVVAVLFFMLLTVVYFSPVVFDGKDLVQGDVVSIQGWGKDLKDYHEQTGQYAFWSNTMFSGMPANYAFMPPTVNIFRYIGQIISFNLPSHMKLVFLYFIGFYIFLLSIGCNPWLSILGSLAYSLASYNFVIIEAGHGSKAFAMAMMAPVLGGIMFTYRKKYLWGILTTLIFTGLQVYSGHQQVTYYLLLIMVIMVVVYFIYAVREHTLKDFVKSSAILVVVGGIAVLPALGNLLPTLDYTKESMRGGAVLQTESTDGKKSNSGLDIDYAFQWSYGIEETMTLLIPNFYGASSHYNIGLDSKLGNVLKGSEQRKQFVQHAPMYWGTQPFTSGPVYAGAIVCFLFILGLFIVKTPERWWLLGATILSILLSWGKNFAVFNDFMFYHLPLYSKFRTPSMSLVMAGVTMATLAVLALKTIIENKDRKKFSDELTKPLYTSLALTGGLALFFAIFGGGMFDFTAASDASYPSWLTDALKADRAHMLTSDALRSACYIALAGALIWLFVKSKVKTQYLLLGLGILVLFDMWGVNKRFLNDNNFVPKKQAKAILPTAADKAILQDTDPNYRVVNLASNTFNESFTSYFHKSVGGYSPAKLRRYQDIIDHHISRRLNMSVLNMLNTRYFIVPSDKGAPQVQKNPDAMGNCWFVDSLQWVNNPNEEIAALNNFNPVTTAVVDTAWKSKLPANLQANTSSHNAKIELAGYAPGNLVYKSSNTQEQLAVFSEVYYKTWKAYIDGQEIPLVRVNYILRGLAVPVGEHTIELKCVDEVYNYSAKIALWSSILVGLILLSLFGLVAYQQRQAKLSA
ncbi:MAG: hypothetical protein LBK47_07455 [Prevotellaceae bacterium]|jgi:hypothetical protein|nr:hypothetical protein [Prevotellaceae bacterium]